MRQIILVFVCAILNFRPSFGVNLPVPDNVAFEKAPEYSNPDNQHL